MQRPHWHRAPLAGAALAACAVAAHAQDGPGIVAQVQTVVVVGATPVPGELVPKDLIPANVQAATAVQLRQLQSLNVPDFMATQLPSVNVNGTQGNPYMMTLNYRGFSASSLLGMPQGLSVYLDGVRVNEPFGDTVNWDLLPTNALATLTLLPGSNPLFGLNTLGGALVLRTKSGDTDPGGEIEVQGGSFGRVATSASYGRALGAHGHLFASLSGFDEEGWRDFSPSRVRQLFVKGGERAADHSWEASINRADSRLVGNGLTPESMLAVDRRAIYTRPDQSRNRMTLFTLGGSRQLGDGYALSATAYARRLDASTVNGDLNDDYDGVEDLSTGVAHRTATTERGAGLAAQLARSFGSQRITLGLSWDQARNHFEQASAQGLLDATRGVIATQPAAVEALIAGTSRTASAYAADLVKLAPSLQLTLSGRYNDTRVRTDDLGRASLGLDTTLDGAGTYARFNPAAGLTWQATPGLTAFGGFSQGNRAPSPIELGCSDPAHPCVLPNALQGDPPLRQVIARTLEAGLRGQVAGGLEWSAAAYRTANRDDLLFIGNGHGSGYFANVGTTLRQGAELALSQETRRVDWHLAYSFLDATFRSAACLLSASNSSAGTNPSCPGAGEIAVTRGNRLPGLPRHSLKVTVDARPLPNWSVGAQVAAYASQLAQGNENNAQQPDGGAFSGAGKVGGYALLDLTTSVQAGGGLELFARLANVFDRRYASGGQLAVAAFDAHGTLRAPADWRHEQFDAPGAPRALWVGARWRFGQAPA